MNKRIVIGCVWSMARDIDHEDIQKALMDMTPAESKKYDTTGLSYYHYNVSMDVSLCHLALSIFVNSDTIIHCYDYYNVGMDVGSPETYTDVLSELIFFVKNKCDIHTID